MFLCTSLFYFVPVMGLVGYVYATVYQRLPKETSSIGFLSIGAFIYDPVTAEGIRYFAETDRKDFLGYTAILIIVAVIVFVISLTCVRYSIFKMSVRLDDELVTNSDFALYITEMEFNDYSKEGMQKEVEEYM